MNIKRIFTLLLLNFLLIGCKDAYINQLNPMSIHQETKASSDVASMQRGENPMNRPSYEEYQESIEPKYKN